MGFFGKLFGKNKAPQGPRRGPVPDAGSYSGFIDHHSHILPGVDDGIGTIEDSLKCLSIYETLGFSKIWLTPHVMEDYPNTTESLRERFGELKEAYSGNIELKLASENMLDLLFAERLEANDFLPMGDHLLVETSYFDGPENLYDLLEEIMHKGYRPLLAHPERYRYMDMSDYRRLRDMGVDLQLNLFSLSGLYGRQAEEKARAMIAAGMYRTSGTDIHDPRQACYLPQVPPVATSLE